MENYIGCVTLKGGEEGVREERLHLNERAQPPLRITADVRLGSREISSERAGDLRLGLTDCCYCVPAQSF